MMRRLTDSKFLLVFGGINKSVTPYLTSADRLYHFLELFFAFTAGEPGGGVSLNLFCVKWITFQRIWKAW